MNFGVALKQIREARGLTQEAVARQLGYKPNWLCRVERGERKLKAQTLFELCKIYGVQPEEVFKRAKEGEGDLRIIRQNAPDFSRGMNGGC